MKGQGQIKSVSGNAVSSTPERLHQHKLVMSAEQTLNASLHVICSRMLCVAAVSSVSTCLTELM